MKSKALLITTIFVWTVLICWAGYVFYPGKKAVSNASFSGDTAVTGIQWPATYGKITAACEAYEKDADSLGAVGQPDSVGPKEDVISYSWYQHSSGNVDCWDSIEASVSQGKVAFVNINLLNDPRIQRVSIPQLMSLLGATEKASVYLRDASDGSSGLSQELCVTYRHPLGGFIRVYANCTSQVASYSRETNFHTGTVAVSQTIKEDCLIDTQVSRITLGDGDIFTTQPTNGVFGRWVQLM